jgi:hypothetical protein
MSLLKTPIFRSEEYRRLVSEMDCAHCGKWGPSQAAHADEGKGMALKADDRTCFPLCPDSPGYRGCHTLIGATGKVSREQRRAYEKTYAAATRERIKSNGDWRPTWPQLEEEA